jgi:hypothetical protein
MRHHIRPEIEALFGSARTRSKAMKKREYRKDLIVYQSKSGAIKLRADVDHETIWATQAQIAQMFAVTPQNVTTHLRSIFKDGELREAATCKQSLQVQEEGGRQVRRRVKLYNLDAIIAIGYRVSSVLGTHFRQWATKTLREHITKGYTIDRQRLVKNYDAFVKAVADVQTLLPERGGLEPKQILDLVNEFSVTWMSLDAYDRQAFEPIGTTRKAVELSTAELTAAIANLRAELIGKGEASDLFAREQHPGGVDGIIGAVMQSFGGKPLYASVEEQAAHLLYFMVKNHPFTDGNKRCGAFAFVWFLRKTGAHEARKITPMGLTALTLLAAESAPDKKDQMTALITHLLRQDA